MWIKEVLADLLELGKKVAFGMAEDYVKRDNEDRNKEWEKVYRGRKGVTRSREAINKVRYENNKLKGSLSKLRDSYESCAKKNITLNSDLETTIEERDNLFRDLNTIKRAVEILKS